MSNSPSNPKISPEEHQNNSSRVPNFTQIPNEFLDLWMPKLTPHEFMILMVICRKTYGWHKVSDAISNKQFVRITGFTKNTILKAIKGLVAHGLLIYEQNTSEELGNLPNTYFLKVTKPDCPYDEKEGDQATRLGRASHMTRVVASNATRVVSSNEPTKETSLNKALNKEKKTNTTCYQKKETSPLPDPSFLSFGEEKKVLLTKEQHDELAAKYGASRLEWMIDFLDAKLAANGKKYVSHYSVLRKNNWVDEAAKEKFDKKKQVDRFGRELTGEYDDAF